MDLVAGAVGNVIVKLGELLHAEYKLQKGLPEQIESLKHELESAQTALCKVGEVLPEQLDPQVQLWAREIREASYDMEDILDMLSIGYLYFIVIDDVWDIPTWKTIKSALVENDSGSRVITTTRSRDVANMEEVYKLLTLPPDHSEKLFKMRLFGVNGEYPAHHPVEASEKILKKCGGIPLAIITMASFLVGKSREDWFVVCNSPGFYRGNDEQQVRDTEWILSLSYYDLPSYLRTCILYLSVYPEDYEIEKDYLIRKWIAEGFVEKKTGTTLFQRGEEYFYQLINRSMIQAVESERTGIVCGCRVHDMVLDLIRDLSSKENFVTISSNDDEGTSPHQNKVRRLAHQNKKKKESQQDDQMDMAHVRSLVACRCDTESLVLHPSFFKLLRVLALEGCRGPTECWQGLEHIGNLLHLRYIGLRHTNGIRELPDEIGKLKFLQTLDLEGSSIGVLPSGVCQLTQLVCLRGGVHTCVPDGSFLTKVTSLEELNICIDNLDEESKRQFMMDLGNLSEVRVLEIMGSLEGMVQSDLELPRHLQHLVLTDILFCQVPSCISPAHLPSLYYLVLQVDDMDEAGLRALGGLPELFFLRLITICPSMASTATVANITAGDGFFQKLRCFSLHGWMVQLAVNEDCTGVSFSIWNGKGAVAFGSKTKDKCSRSAAPPPVMPNLQQLDFDEVPVRALYKHGNGSCGDLRLECLPSLRKVEIIVDCEGASADDVEKAEAELRNAAQLHPNGPKIEIELMNEDEMIWSEDEMTAQSTDQDDKEPVDGDYYSAEEQEGDISSAGDEGDISSAGDEGDNPATPSC